MWILTKTQMLLLSDTVKLSAGKEIPDFCCYLF